MNRIRTVTLVLALGWSMAASAEPWWAGLTGNDTGGIIPWTEGHELVASEWAARHCARYGKFARFTSNRREYGYYIAFECDWRSPPGYSARQPD